MAVHIPYHVVKSPRMIWARYVKNRCVFGAIPYQLRLHDLYWEKRFGADTGGWVAVELTDGKLYEATPYLLIEDILCHLDLQRHDVFLDLGCGKGRVTCMAARTNASRIMGLDQESGFLEVARKNLSGISDVRAQVDFHHGLAQDFNFDTTTVAFLFNPFGADTLRDVLNRMRQSLERNPRRFRIVYVNPMHEHVLSNADWLSNTHTWPSAAYADFEIQPPNTRLVSFWEANS